MGDSAGFSYTCGRDCRRCGERDKGMAAMTKIPWTEVTWNPVVGCKKIAPGCKNCYAERMACRLAYMGQEKYQRVTGYVNEWTHWLGDVYCDKSVLDKPLHWRRPRKIFVCSMGDLFHEKVPFEFIDKVMAVIALCPQHTFQILTKRIERAAEYVLQEPRGEIDHAILDGMAYFIGRGQPYAGKGLTKHLKGENGLWPLNNLWFGTSISTQADADKNIPILLQIPAAVRFVSLEPMLERIDLTDIHPRLGLSQDVITDFTEDTKQFNEKYKKHLKDPLEDEQRLDWVIIGCESGPKARLCSPEDIRDAVRQCREANVPVFIKQVPVDCNSCHDKCSKNPKEWPEDLRIQEYPEIANRKT